jgi:hypothetical protein
MVMWMTKEEKEGEEKEGEEEPASRGVVSAKIPADIRAEARKANLSVAEYLRKLQQERASWEAQKETPTDATVQITKDHVAHLGEEMKKETAEKEAIQKRLEAESKAREAAEKRAIVEQKDKEAKEAECQSLSTSVSQLSKGSASLVDDITKDIMQRIKDDVKKTPAEKAAEISQTVDAAKSLLKVVSSFEDDIKAKIKKDMGLDKEKPKEDEDKGKDTKGGIILDVFKQIMTTFQPYLPYAISSVQMYVQPISLRFAIKNAEALGIKPEDSPQVQFLLKQQEVLAQQQQQSLEQAKQAAAQQQGQAAQTANVFMPPSAQQAMQQSSGSIPTTPTTPMQSHSSPQQPVQQPPLDQSQAGLLAVALIKSDVDAVKSWLDGHVNIAPQMRDNMMNGIKNNPAIIPDLLVILDKESKRTAPELLMQVLKFSEPTKKQQIEQMLGTQAAIDRMKKEIDEFNGYIIQIRQMASEMSQGKTG